MSNVASQDVSLRTLLTLNKNDLKEFVCGWGAAVINVSITFPINKIIFRQVCKVYETVIGKGYIYTCVYTLKRISVIV